MSAGCLRFDTALGEMAVCWEGAALTRVFLPGDALPESESTAPEFASRAQRQLQAWASGEPVEFDVPLAMELVPPFERRVLEAARAIPSGETVTYGELARRCGSPGAARAVGRAMARNPFPAIVPCHRVLASDGALTGFSSAGGTPLKARLLRLESRQGELPI